MCKYNKFFFKKELNFLIIEILWILQENNIKDAKEQIDTHWKHWISMCDRHCFVQLCQY